MTQPSQRTPSRKPRLRHSGRRVVRCHSPRSTLRFIMVPAFSPNPKHLEVPVDIPDWRKQIDDIDEQIVHLISRRAEAAKAIGDLKHERKLPIYEPKREQAVIEHVLAVNPGPLADAEMLHVYERIMDVMRTLQRHED
ncbi:MAG: hypothetical protein NVSMB62_15120 [Acidobacteriaceae bacterium]